MIEKIILAAIKIYQLFFSPLSGRHCRFYPSCSEYMIQAVKKYGPLPGCLKGLKRILKCSPWQPGGVELP